MSSCESQSFLDKPLVVRDVPEEVLAALDARAGRLGVSRNEYLRRRLTQEAATGERPVSIDDRGGIVLLRFQV